MSTPLQGASLCQSTYSLDSMSGQLSAWPYYYYYYFNPLTESRGPVQGLELTPSKQLASGLGLSLKAATAQV